MMQSTLSLLRRGRLRPGRSRRSWSSPSSAPRSCWCARPGRRRSRRGGAPVRPGEVARGVGALAVAAVLRRPARRRGASSRATGRSRRASASTSARWTATSPTTSTSAAAPDATTARRHGRDSWFDPSTIAAVPRRRTARPQSADRLPRGRGRPPLPPSAAGTAAWEAAHGGPSTPLDAAAAAGRVLHDDVRLRRCPQTRAGRASSSGTRRARRAC